MRFTLTTDYAPSYTLYVNVEVTDSSSFLTGTIPSVITIASGTRTSDLILETDNDSVDEPHGTITAKINSGSNYLLGSPSSASMRVFDNDAAPVIPILSISADSTPVTEGSYVTFRVRANRAPSTLLYINVNATENGQFLAEVPVTEITMDAGATETLYILRTENDSTDEPNGSVTGNLDTGTTYTINTSARSAVVEVLDNDLPRPPAPEGFELTFADSDSISLAWDRLPGASSYRVRHSLSGGNRWTYHGESISRTLTVSRLANDRLYDFQAQARGNNTAYDNVLGDWSGTITGSTPKVSISNLGSTLVVGQTDNFNVVATSLNRHLDYALSVLADQETGLRRTSEEDEPLAFDSASSDCDVKIRRTNIPRNSRSYTWNPTLVGCEAGTGGLSAYLLDRTGFSNPAFHEDVDDFETEIGVVAPPPPPPQNLDATEDGTSRVDLTGTRSAGFAGTSLSSAPASTAPASKLLPTSAGRRAVTRLPGCLPIPPNTFE